MDSLKGLNSPIERRERERERERDAGRGKNVHFVSKGAPSWSILRFS
jgi:hypothetical protein